MSLFTALLVFVVGFVSGTVVRWVAGLAAVVALVLAVLGVANVHVGLVSYVIKEYYVGNELLFLAGFLFAIDAEHTREVVVERR